MFEGQHSKQFIEQVYLQTSRDMEKTLDKFLTNELPQE